MLLTEARHAREGMKSPQYVHPKVEPEASPKEASERAFNTKPGKAIRLEPNRSIKAPTKGERKMPAADNKVTPNKIRVRLQPNSSDND